MSTDTTPPRTWSLSERVAANIRAWMGWHQIRQSELARRIGANEQWLSVRLRGKQPIDLNDLQRIAHGLGVKPEVLLSDNAPYVTVTDVADDRPNSGPRTPLAGRSELAATRPQNRRIPAGPGRTSRTSRVAP